MKWTKNKALGIGGRYRTEEKGDWKYWDGEFGATGLDENELWYACEGDKEAETPSGVKCMAGTKDIKSSDMWPDQCSYSSYELVCDYDPD